MLEEDVDFDKVSTSKSGSLALKKGSGKNTIWPIATIVLFF
jgi:hypothetical protein